VIAARRGGCVGLATLYLAAAERWGLPAHGVLVPGHLFVRAAGPKGQLRGVELLRRGEAMPEAWYRARYGLPAAGPPPRAYLRALTADEVLAVVRFNLANELREAGALRRAAASYARAAASFPDFAEAHASLGLSLQLLGEAEAAAAAYDGAMRVHPGLPGLAENVAALARSRPAAAAPPAR
jgi:regulator of sirC expression with transglutaminase-like and TPR domain